MRLRIAAALLALPTLLAPATVTAEPDAEVTAQGEVIVIVGHIPRGVDEGTQVVEVVDRKTIELTAADDLTDVLKKTASVDVIQYPGALSGIGLRGFRPEFSGTTNHTLVLVDGRPAGAANLATLPAHSVEQVEVLLGPGSASYGGQAVGGVVNLVRRRTVGPMRAGATAGYGSAQTWQADAYVGGNASDAVDFDVSGQLDARGQDMRLGDGTTRAHTEYESYAARARTRVRASSRWSVEVDGDVYAGRDIESPGDIFRGESQQGRKDLDRAAVALTSTTTYGAHEISLVGFGTTDESRTTDMAEGTPAHRSFDTAQSWLGGQARYRSRLGAHRIATGIEVERVAAHSRAYDVEGMRKAPYSPDNRRTTAAGYAHGHSELGAGVLATYGARADVIGVATLDTPLKTDFTPGTAYFTTVNPSVGIARRWRALRPHASAGTAFVPPQAAQMAGSSAREVDGVTMVTRGNPDLRPERAWSADAGLAVRDERWGLDADVTGFVTRIADKIDRAQTSATETTFANVGTGRIEGWQGKLTFDLGRAADWRVGVRPFAAWTHIIRANEGDGDERTDIHNVARWNVRWGLELTGERWSARALARHRGTVLDTDWNEAGYPEIAYPTFTIVDAVGRVQVTDHHHVTIEGRNLTDRLYFEKKGFPLMGRSFFVRYGVSL